MSGTILQEKLRESGTLLAGRVALSVPAAEAWSFIRDMENYPRWFPGILRMRSLDDKPIGVVGKRYSELAELPGGGVEEISVEVVVANEADMHLAIEADLVPVLPRFDYRVVAAGENKCVFEWQAGSRGEGLFAWFGRRVFPRVVGPRLKRGLTNLKRVLEKPPRDIMRAVQFREFGPARDVTVIESAAARPSPGKGEVLVRQLASSVNHIDCLRRQGYGQRIMSLRGALNRPVTLGNDVCGVVTEVGAGAERFASGVLVLGVKPPSSSGSFADYVVARADLLVPFPTTMDPAVVAGAPYVFITAWNAVVNEGGLSPRSGKKLFVQGGGGGVGAMAVQIGKSLGAHVIASCAADQIDAVLSMGADEAIDYATTDLSDRAGQFDLVICTANAAEQAQLIALLKTSSEARYVTVIHPTLSLVDDHGIIRGMLAAKRQLRQLNRRLKTAGQSAHWVLFKAQPDALAALGRMIHGGELVVPVDSVWPLDRAAEAQERLESGKANGKVILKIGEKQEIARWE
ncbi:zinc-binding dehydrogenase [Parerythrobacter aurantius]|uniref:zinc-binding dehydrogenase n=1 Tax=Parerythrobacter aurantius TaxID=3127706 RepID=UPI003248EFE8